MQETSPLTRQNDLYLLLYHRQDYSQKELALQYNVSTKTISRDFEYLSSLFDDVERHGYKWRLNRPYNYNSASFFHKELKARLSDFPKEMLDLTRETSLDQKFINTTLLEISKALGHTFYEESSKLLQTKGENCIYNKVSFEDISDIIDLLHTIKASIVNQKEIRFKYRHFYCDVQPYKLLSFDGFWYILGIDIHTNIMKKYALKKVQDLIVQSQEFKQKTDISKQLENAINIWFDPQTKGYEVQLLLSKSIAPYILSRPLNKTQRILQNYPNKEVEISLIITHEMELLPTIGYWLPEIKIISPDTLKKSMLRKTSQYIEAYL